MNYPGNESLAENIQQRILTTYEQTLELAAKGSTQEALLGCDFILRMDPDFEIAQVLQERLRAGNGPVQVADLHLDALTEGGTPAFAQESEVRIPQEGVLDLGDLDKVDDLDGEIPDWSSMEETKPEILEAEALEAALAELLANRELQRLVQIADQHKEEVARSPAIRKLVTTAYTRLEAEPYVQEFLAGARAAIQAGNAEEARRLLEKGRSLDPSHPGIEEVGRVREVFGHPGPAPIQATQPPAQPTQPPAAGPQEIPEESFGAMLMPEAGSGAPAAGFASPSPEPPSLGQGFGPPSELTPAGFDLDPPPPLVQDLDADADAQGADDRIGQLLLEGQNAFDQSHYQSAIDSWSRIFLIDIDHEEAARRIDLARQHKAEDERRVEQIFSEAIAAYDADRVEESKQGFQQVLELNPSHMAAREYLEQIERGTMAAEMASTIGGTGGAGLPDLPLLGDDPLSEPLPGAVMVPPDGTAPSFEAGGSLATQAGVSSSSGSLRKFLMVGLPVLLVLAAAGWYVWTNRADLFPNSTAQEEAGPPDVLIRAKKLNAAGKTPLAIRLLEGVSTVEPGYDEAQQLIEQWQAESELDEAVAEEDTTNADEVAREQAERQERSLAAARDAFARGDNLLTVRRFEEARRLGPLPAEDTGTLTEANRQLEPLQRQITYFQQGEFEVALPILWRLHEDDPSNRDVTRLMVDSYYNLAVRDLQRGDAALAAEKLAEASQLGPGDAALERHLLFARTYSERQKDLQYWIYAKYLPSR